MTAAARKPVVAVLLGITVCAGGSAFADDRRSPRDVASENGRFVLQLEAGRGCRATLIEHDTAGSGDKGAGQRRWRRMLAGETAPTDAAVRDDGRFVVTLDELRRGAARSAVVIYGERGQVLRRFNIANLLRRSDWRELRQGGRRAEWLDQARYGFDDPADQFVIQTRWGREVRIDLKNVRVVDGEDASDDPIGELGDVPPELLAELSEADEAAPDAAAIEALAQRLNLSIEELQALIEQGFYGELVALPDNATESDVSPELREAVLDMAIAGAIREGIGESIGAGIAKAATEGIAEHVAETEAAEATEQGVVTEEITTQVHDGPANYVFDVFIATDASPNRLTAVAPPAPNPYERTDYVAWMNEMARVEGESAVPFFQAAIEQSAPWNGDKALYDAAMAGDAAALNSPEISAWLDANRGALEQFRAATSREFGGWPMKSENGDLIGVLLPNLAPMRQLARTAVIDGKRLEAQGRTGEAVSSYIDTLAAGAQAGQGPTLIENLVGVAMQSLANEAILDAISHDNGNLDYADLQRRLEQNNRTPRPVAETVQFERAAYLDSMQRVFEPNPYDGKLYVNLPKARELASMVSGGESNPLSQIRDTLSYMSLNYETTLSEGNAFYDALTDATASPYPEAQKKLAELENAMSRETINPMLRMLAPSISRANFIRTRSEAARQASQLVTNVMAYKQQHGRLPDSLDAFAGREFAVDPFTSSGFAYRREGDGFTLYSLGGNGADDGGVHDAKGDSNDLVYWPRPAK